MASKLDQLRELLRTADGGNPVSAFIIPTEDAHMGEYPPDCDARRVFITGFTGSAGTAVVTDTEAACWTDGRYFLQAADQLEEGWTLMKHGTPECPEIEDWLVSKLPAGAAVGFDPWVHTVSGSEKLRGVLEREGLRLVPLASNPVDEVWGAARPAAPSGAVRLHALEWAGKAATEKLAELRAEMAKRGASALLVTALDEVAWLLNIRGADVDHNPVVLAYVLVEKEAATLFVDELKVGPEAAAALAAAGRVRSALARAATEAVAAGTRVWLDPGKVNAALRETAASAALTDADAPAPASARRGTPVALAKAIKNEAELAGMREAHLRDAVALVGFLRWLEAELVVNGRSFTEVEIDEHLTARRAAQPGFVTTSFDTIAGAGPNGAVIHYRAEPGSARTVDAGTLLLLDSGGQYDCGTTDITRTMHFGAPSEHERRSFTRVLKGHIALDRAVFPEGTPGAALDALARLPLWELGLNYRHGTGHGVGAALNVHEGPQSISSRLHITAGLRAGMICSNEPGYYEDGAFGIRIENLFAVVEAQTPFRFGGQAYLTADCLTFVPMQKKMMLKEDLTDLEVAWVNAYHARVYEKVAPRLDSEEDRAWLELACAPL
ncbi:hypothetical protein QBZ16_000761 [Prototheca wickerhamii]|uniref:Xaa-Pro aminopeptidase n=1 Tax=Prototheca wickerhamii TaxID=3111 RepID=A0AAD9IQ52_PROWI|nr:hypothetical protein QBZ16_000761 [Prototheca wickerhamii]